MIWIIQYTQSISVFKLGFLFVLVRSEVQILKSKWPHNPSQEDCEPLHPPLIKCFFIQHGSGSGSACNSSQHGCKAIRGYFTRGKPSGLSLFERI